MLREILEGFALKTRPVVHAGAGRHGSGADQVGDRRGDMDLGEYLRRYPD